MKCRFVQIILLAEVASIAAQARLDNQEDTGIQTEEQAAAYKGATFQENDSTCKDLHVVYRDGFVMVNFVDEEGVRINYDYPTHQLGRVKHY